MRVALPSSHRDRRKMVINLPKTAEKDCLRNQKSVLKLSTFNNKLKTLKMPVLTLPLIRITEISMKKYRCLFLPHNLEEYTAQQMKVRGQRRTFKSLKDSGCCKRHYKRDYINTKKILLFRISKKGLRCTLEEAMALITPCLTH